MKGKHLYCFAAGVAAAVIVISTGLMNSETVPLPVLDLSREAHQTFNMPPQDQSIRGQLFNIVWLHPGWAFDRYWLTSEDKLFRGFETCEYRNCNITYSYNSSEAASGDAVIFPGRWLGPKYSFKRPFGQVWVFFELESPEHMDSLGGNWRREPWKSQFNWTMTYDTSIADISFKYGDIRLKPTHTDRNYTAIALNKTDDVLIINSHCSTPSKREMYIAELRKHVPVTVLGDCGVRWKCGRRYLHDDCFQILNQYRYYLAFENSLCDMYFTEKVFDNFKYDTVLITQGGGRKGEIKNVLPEGTYIATDDYDSAKSLADYLKKLSSSVADYAEILKRKDQYYSSGFAAMYKQAMCDVCKMMNWQDEYRQTIPDMGKWRTRYKSCRKPDDIKYRDGRFKAYHP